MPSYSNRVSTPSNPYRKHLLRAALVTAVLAAIGVWSMGGIDLAALQAWRTQWQAQVQASPIAASLAFVAVYATATALSVPGATLMTLLGGAWFGTFWGTALVSAASTLGATGAMLLARTFLRDWVQRRWGSRLASIHQGMEREGGWYLLSLRLLPVAPFFLINLAMGLTRIPLRTYIVASAAGMLPATVLYVNAGEQLASIETLSGLLAPQVWLSLAALGLLPWCVKLMIKAYERRQRLLPWKGVKPKSFDRNLIVIGAGAAGLVGAYMGVTLKGKVTLVEASAMGGDCLNHGCVPSKALLHSAHQIQQALSAQSQGLINLHVHEHAFAQAMKHVRRSIEQIAPHDSTERYLDLGVDVVHGHAELISPWHVRITPNDAEPYTLSSANILLATGAEPVIPPIEGLIAERCVTSDNLWQDLQARDHAPRQVVIMGGGPIGCEMAQALSLLGSHVHLLERGAHILPHADPGAAELLAQTLQKHGVTVHTQASVQRVEHLDHQTVVRWTVGDTPHSATADLLLVAVGRKARCKNLGFEALGIRCTPFIEHNAYLQTHWPHIWVAGDAAGPKALTHAAAHQASTAAINMLTTPFWRRSADAPWMPSVVYTQPEVAQAGITAAEAQKLGVDAEVTTYHWDESDRAITENATQGFLRLYTHPSNGHVLGVCAVGAHAAEALAPWVEVIRQRRKPSAMLAKTYAYPTYTEAGKAIAGQWQKAKLSPLLHTWLNRIQRWKRRR